MRDSPKELGSKISKIQKIKEQAYLIWIEESNQ